MKFLPGVMMILFSLGASPGSAPDGELVLFKESITDVFARHPFGSECSGLYPVKRGKNVPDLRDFQYYFCEGIYSLTLEGPPQTTVTLFGSFFHRTGEGYLILRKADDRKVWIIDLEQFQSGKWIHVDPEDNRYGSYDVFYREAPNFERNLSSVKWGPWWDGTPPSVH